MDGSLLDTDTDGGRSVEDLVKLSRSVLGTAREELTEDPSPPATGKAPRSAYAAEWLIHD